MIFDTHAHYNSSAFAKDRDSLLCAMKSAGVGRILIPSEDFRTSAYAVYLSEKYRFISAAVGWHPEEIRRCRKDSMAEIRALAIQYPGAAIGEIGLDYYWDKDNKEEQKKYFRAQLEISVELHRPAIVHDREAHGDTLDVIRSVPNCMGVLHCFSGSKEMAAQLLEKGWYLGFDGPITYRNNRKQLEVLQYCPLDRILVETDSPYLTPVPLRGKRNDSRNLPYILQVVADCKRITAEEAEKITWENGIRLFGGET